MIDKKFCQKGRKNDLMYKADEIKALLGVLYSKPINNLSFLPTTKTTD